MSIRFIFCRICQNYNADGSFSCKAFPEGIPKSILYGHEFHFKQIPGDNGIKFEVVQGKEFLLKFADMD